MTRRVVGGAAATRVLFGVVTLAVVTLALAGCAVPEPATTTSEPTATPEPSAAPSLPASGMEIVPGRGIGPFAFGMSADELVRQLGEADAMSEARDGSGLAYWRYDAIGISFHVRDAVVVGMTCLSPRHAIAGVLRVGMEWRDAVDRVERSFGRPIQGRLFESDAGAMFTVPEFEVTLEIDGNGVIRQINLEPIPGVAPEDLPEPEAREERAPARTADTATAAQPVGRGTDVTRNTGPVTFPHIERDPGPNNFGRGVMGKLPRFDPNLDPGWQVDLRGFDLSRLDLRNRADDLLHADFDDRTIWPDDNQMPSSFDRTTIMELGRSPGLGVRELHGRGVTGEGIGIAIIDQPLLTTHQEYADRLRFYEEININPRWEAAMHGAAVASVALGETVGVAPGADLYYVAEWRMDIDPPPEGDRGNFAITALAVRRILEINEQLPPEQRIRVISISVGWGPNDRGYAEMMAAVREATEAGMLVICSSVEAVHGFSFHGLGRDPMADPEAASSYVPGTWWADSFYDRPRSFGAPWRERTLLVPMDSRTTASPTGDEDYVYYKTGGWSWSIPWIAGLYALVAQVEPDVTPEWFWRAALATGTTITVSHDGQELEFGTIANPVALIEAFGG